MAPNETPDAALIAGDACGHTPERRCILTGAVRPRGALIRLVVGPDAALWPDFAGRLPGRGAWIAPNRAALESAIRRGKLKGALARAFGTPLPAIPDDLPNRIADGLERRALERLGLEQRAGHLLFGSEKIGEWARAGRVQLMLHAADAADDGIGKLDQAFRVGGGEMAQSIRLPAGRDALSRALGRGNVVHSGVTDAKAAARIRSDLLRWIAYLDPTSPSEPVLVRGVGSASEPGVDATGEAARPTQTGAGLPRADRNEGPE
jgi:predicted RNA-binding protein YlxR (DUF448 family)